MSGISGPSTILTKLYPTVSMDGLIFCWDPKNKTTLPILEEDPMTYNMIKAYDLEGTGINIGMDELAGSITNEGYISFDGTDDLFDVGPRDPSTYNVPLLQFSDEFTVSTWVRTNNVAQVNQRAYTYTNVGANQGVSMKISSAAIFEVYSSAGYNYSTWQNSGTAADYLVNGEWYNLVGVKRSNSEADNVICFKNGVYPTGGNSTVGTATDIAYGTGTSSWPLRVAIGSGYYYVSGTFNEWVGDLGPLMIWNRALSNEEVSQNYNQIKGRFGL